MSGTLESQGLADRVKNKSSDSIVYLCGSREYDADWCKKQYSRRTGVERINGRIDRDYQFERHTIRGLSKMRMFLTVTFLAYMAMAKVKIESGQRKHP